MTNEAPLTVQEIAEIAARLAAALTTATAGNILFLPAKESTGVFICLRTAAIL